MTGKKKRTFFVTPFLDDQSDFQQWRGISLFFSFERFLI